jgi:rsbT co-antagonist protein RsbR
MPPKTSSRIPEILEKHEADLLAEWVRTLSATLRRSDLLSDAELRAQCTEFLHLFQNAVQTGLLTQVDGSAWAPMRDFLSGISRSRAVQGFTPRETALFVFSLKEPLFTRLRTEVKKADELADEVMVASKLLDELGLYTAESYQKVREEVIRRQQEELLELSTPVVKLWDGILALPLIGTLDSARTQTVMENLLETIVAQGAEVAIIDITGVPTVDTLTAQHLLRTVTAARLMGADCIISGIRPQIAQTIVHLGVELGDVATKATLADAFLLALKRTGATAAVLRARG